MASVFMYLAAIIDVYSRFVVGWHVVNSLEVSVEVLKAAIERYGKLEIANSDQESHYTSKDWVEYLQSSKTDGREIKISMDGKGRATDNIWIERFWRTIKRGYVYYLHPAKMVLNCIVACATILSTTITLYSSILLTTGYRPAWLTECYIFKSSIVLPLIEIVIHQLSLGKVIEEHMPLTSCL